MLRWGAGRALVLRRRCEGAVRMGGNEGEGLVEGRGGDCLDSSIRLGKADELMKSLMSSHFS